MEIILAIVSILLIISVFLALVRNDFWVFKILEYPRVQKLAIIIFVGGCWLYFWPLQSLFHKMILGGLVVSVFYLLYKIWPYTPFSKKRNDAGETGR